MHKITFINSHKRKKRFTYEVFGFLYSVILIGIFIYYLANESDISKFANDLFTIDYDPSLKPFFFILIFSGLLLMIFNFGFIGIFKTRISFFLYPAAFLTCLFLSLSGFLYGQDIGFHIFNTHVITYAFYFLVLILCFIFEKPDLSKYGSCFMRITDMVCSIILILYALWTVSGVFAAFHARYCGYFQIFIIFTSLIYVMINSIYVLLKYESRYNIK